MVKKVAIIMGSKSDYPTMQVAEELLKTFEISIEVQIISAHRTPQKMYEFAQNAKLQGFGVIIAGAGGAAHLPGMSAALTTLPVIGVPIESKALQGIDSLLSIVQMPKGVPVATVAIGTAGAANAAILAAQILAVEDDDIAQKLQNYRIEQEQIVAQMNREVL